jgi:uncharacterized protein YjiS (DUF1127 family)
MATLTLILNVSLSPTPTWTPHIAAWFSSRKATILALASVLHTRAVLRRLDDETLADIGMPRLDQFGRPASRRFNIYR